MLGAIAGLIVILAILILCPDVKQVAIEMSGKLGGGSNLTVQVVEE